MLVHRHGEFSEMATELLAALELLSGPGEQKALPQRPADLGRRSCKGLSRQGWRITSPSLHLNL